MEITTFQIVSMAVMLFNVVVTIGGFAWFGGRLTGRFEGHENLDNARFDHVLKDLNEIKKTLLTK